MIIFSLAAHRALAYPLGDTKLREDEQEALTAVSAEGAPTVLLDYMGMALNAADYGCAVITARASYDGALLSVYCGSDLIVTPDSDYCLTQTLSSEYRSYLLDFSRLPGWDMAVNLLQLSLRGAETLSVKSVQFYPSASQAPNPDAVMVPAGSEPENPTRPPVTAIPATATPVTATPVTATPADATPVAATSTDAPTAGSDSTAPGTAAPSPSPALPASPSAAQQDSRTSGASDSGILLLMVLSAAAVAVAAVFLSMKLLKKKN